MYRSLSFLSACAVAALVLGPVGPKHAQADPVADFYRGKTINIVVSFGAGGMYSYYALLLSNHMGRHIPGNPNMIVQHMPGAGGLKATNYLYGAAPRDGTYIGTVVKDLAVDQVLRPDAVRYDASKFNWIGRINDYISILWVTDKAGVRTLEEAKHKEVILGASGRTSGTYVHPMLLNRLVGTKFKIVVGYKGAADLNQAAEIGETHGWANGAYVGFQRPGSRQEMLKDGRAIPLMLTGTQRQPDAPDVPLFIEQARTEEARQIIGFVDSVTELGWSFFTPPDVPAERVAALREAFAAAMKDPKLIADAERGAAPLNYAPGEEIAKIVDDTLAVSPEIVARMRELVGF